MTILALTQLPPPRNGATTMNQATVEILSQHNSLIELDLSLSTSITESNKLSIAKIAKLTAKYFKLISILLTNKEIKGCYFTITPTGPSFVKDSVYALILKAFGVPTIYHLHGNGIKRKYRPPYKWIYDAVFKNSSIIVLSEALAHDINFIKKTKIYILNNFTNIPGPAIKTAPVHRNIIKLGFLSNLRKGKGVHELIEIAANLAGDGVDFEIHIAGPWSSHEDKKAFFSNKKLLEGELSSRFKFIGEVSGEKKTSFFNCIDVFVFPSFIDTFPLVLLESLSFGKPIICSNIGGMIDIATPDVGYVFNHEDPNKYEKISQEIKKLCSAQYYLEKSTSAINSSLKLYTKDSYSKKLIGIISEFLNRSQ